MATSTEVIKRQGERTSQTYDPIKLHHSVRAACLSVRSPEGEAELIAKSVVGIVSKWCYEKHAITSGDIRRIAAQFLERMHPDAAYLYENHQLVL